MRDKVLKNFTKNFKLYREATSVWAVESTKIPIEKIILNQDGSLHFNSYLNPKYINDEERDYRLDIIKSVCEDIIIDLDEKTRKEYLEPDHLVFFFNFTENGAFISNNFLTKFELDRVFLDQSGSLIGMTDSRKKLILGMFILGKIYVPRVFVKPESIGFD